MDPEAIRTSFLEQASKPDNINAYPGMDALRRTSLDRSADPKFTGDALIRQYREHVGALYQKRLGDLGMPADPQGQRQLEDSVHDAVRTHALDTLAGRMEEEGQTSRFSVGYLAPRVPFLRHAGAAADLLKERDAQEAFQSRTADGRDFLHEAGKLAESRRQAKTSNLGKAVDAVSTLPAVAAEWAPGAAAGDGLARAGNVANRMARAGMEATLGQAPRWGTEAALATAQRVQRGEPWDKAAGQEISKGVISSGVFGAVDPLGAGFGSNYIAKVANKVALLGAASETEAGAQKALGLSEQAGPLAELWAAKTKEDRQKAATNLLVNFGAVGLMEAGLHIHEARQGGHDVDMDKAVDEGAQAVLDAAKEKPDANAGTPPGPADRQEAGPAQAQAPGNATPAEPGPQAPQGQEPRPTPAPGAIEDRGEGHADQPNGTAAAGAEPGPAGQPDAAGAPGLPASAERVLDAGRVDELRKMLAAVGEKSGRLSDARVIERARELKLDQFQDPGKPTSTGTIRQPTALEKMQGEGEPAGGMGAASPSGAPPLPQPGAPGTEAPVIPEREPPQRPPQNVLQKTADWFKSFAQQTFPSLTRLSSASGEKLAQAANARAAAKASWDYFGGVLKVNGKPLHDLSPEESRMVGAVWLETRFRHDAETLTREANAAAAEAIRLTAQGAKPERIQEWQDKAKAAREEAKGVATLVGQPGSPLQTEQDYKQGHGDLWSFWQAVQQEWTPAVEKNYRGLKNIDPQDAIDSPSQIPGLPLNAIAVKEGDDVPGAVGVSGGASMAGLRIRNPGFTQRAHLDAPAYDVDVRHMMQRTLEAGISAARRSEFVRTAVDEGVVKAVGGTAPPPDDSYDAVSNGRYAVDTNKHPDPPNGWQYAADPLLPGHWAFLEREPAKAPPGWKYLGLDPAKGLGGIDPNARYYAHPDAYTNIMQGLGVGERPGAILSGVAAVNNALNQTALLSTVEVATHLANQTTAMFRPGMGIPGINLITDTLPTAIKVYAKDPEAMAQIRDLAAIGASFEHGQHISSVPGISHVQRFTTGLIDVVQKAMRIQLGAAYDRMVDKGYFAASETGKRDFINQALGNYGAQANNRLQQALKDTGFQPFATAASTFTVQGIKSGFTGAINAPATSTANAVKLRALALAKFVPIMAAVAAGNLLRWGSALPKDVPVFAFKTSEDKDGTVYYFDPLQFTGQRRGWRGTGVRAVAEGINEGRTTGQIADRAVRDIVVSQEHLVAGPAVQAVHTLLTGEDALGRKVAKPISAAKTTKGQASAAAKGLLPAGSSQYKQNLIAALKNVNPIVATLTDADHPPSPRTLMQKAARSLGPFGVKERKPSTGTVPAKRLPLAPSSVTTGR